MKCKRFQRQFGLLWVGAVWIVMLLHPATGQARPSPEPYDFLRTPPSRHWMGLTFGSPGWMVGRYEWALLKGEHSELPRASLGVDALLMMPGGGVAYRHRAGATPLFFTFGYQYISIPQTLREGELDLGPAVRHNAEFGIELRSWNNDKGKSWILGVGAALEILPGWERRTLRVMGTVGVLHRL